MKAKSSTLNPPGQESLGPGETIEVYEAVSPAHTTRCQSMNVAFYRIFWVERHVH